ncbi:MAG: hypothetical protein M1824_001719 [Vezdaea acicularis]|nr:MAG: hypothetical protein M1824_001719 [Vezdaea acicularis]
MPTNIHPLGIGKMTFALEDTQLRVAAQGALTVTLWTPLDESSSYRGLRDVSQPFDVADDYDKELRPIPSTGLRSCSGLPDYPRMLTFDPLEFLVYITKMFPGQWLTE